jgi:hypothetical protein
LESDARAASSTGPIFVVDGVPIAGDNGKVRLLASAVKDLASATR